MFLLNLFILASFTCLAMSDEELINNIIDYNIKLLREDSQIAILILGKQDRPAEEIERASEAFGEQILRINLLGHAPLKSYLQSLPREQLTEMHDLIQSKKIQDLLHISRMFFVKFEKYEQQKSEELSDEKILFAWLEEFKIRAIRKIWVTEDKPYLVARNIIYNFMQEIVRQYEPEIIRLSEYKQKYPKYDADIKKILAQAQASTLHF